MGFTSYQAGKKIERQHHDSLYIVEIIQVTQTVGFQQKKFKGKSL